MLDNIISLVKEEVTKTITESNAISDDKKDAAIEATTSGILNGLKNEINPENISSIMGLFNNEASVSGSNLSNSIQQSVVSALSSKIGLDSGTANKIAAAIIPALLGLFAKKSNDPNDSFSIESVLHSLTGSNEGGGILGKIGKMFGM